MIIKNHWSRTNMIKALFIIIFLFILSHPTALAFEQGMVVGDAPELRQEALPFIPLKGGLVLDPVTNQIILLFQKQIELENNTPTLQLKRPGTQTEKKTFPKTLRETETGTLTIKTLPK